MLPRCVPAVLAAGFMFVCPAPAAAQAGTADIAYTLAADGDFSAFDVTLRFRGEEDGETGILLPSEWGPEAGLDRQFSDFGIIEADGEPRPVEAAGGRIDVVHAPGAWLTLHYRFAQDYDGLPSWEQQRVPGMRPVTQPGFAVFVGAAAFVHPEMSADDTLTYTVRADVDGSPVEISSSLGEGMAIETGALTPASFLDTLWLFGDFSRSTHLTDGARVHTAIRGDLPLARDAFQDLADRTIAGAAGLFDDVPFDSYLMAAMPLPPIPDQSAVIGTALHQSFFLLTTSNAGAAEVRRTVAHEILHEWITGRMGPTDEATDPARMWFTEGFTEYFTHLVRLRQGEIDLQGFLDAMNGLDAEYRVSPVRGLPRDELIERLWESRETERLPYQRGALLAFLTDSDLAGRDDARLADVVANLIAENQSHLAQTGVPLPLTDDRIAAALEHVAGGGAVSRIDAVTGDGAILTMPAGLLFGCIETRPEGPAFSLADGADAQACEAEITRG